MTRAIRAMLSIQVLKQMMMLMVVAARVLMVAIPTSTNPSPQLTVNKVTTISITQIVDKNHKQTNKQTSKLNCPNPFEPKTWLFFGSLHAAKTCLSGCASWTDRILR